MTVRIASDTSDASGANEDRRGMGEEKSFPCPELRKKRKPRKRKRKRAGHGRGKRSPMPRIVIKEEAKEEKKEESGAWERKKVSHAPNRDKRGSQGREKGKERGMGEEKSHPCPES